MFAHILKGAPYGNDNAKGGKHQGRTSISGIDTIKRMKKEGWLVSRVTGSHHFMKKEGYPPIPVPAHHKDLGIGLLKEISKHTGIIF